MKALILRDDTEAAVACAQALLHKGFQVVCVENRHIARALLRIETIDLLLLDERIDGRLTHSIALTAERKNPYINAILMTDRTAPDVDDLYDLLPCLYAIAGIASDAALIAQLAMSSIESFEEAETRLRRNMERAQEEEKRMAALIANKEVFGPEQEVVIAKPGPNFVEPILENSILAMEAVETEAEVVEVALDDTEVAMQECDEAIQEIEVAMSTLQTAASDADVTTPECETIAAKVTQTTPFVDTIVFGSDIAAPIDRVPDAEHILTKEDVVSSRFRPPEDRQQAPAA